MAANSSSADRMMTRMTRMMTRKTRTSADPIEHLVPPGLGVHDDDEDPAEQRVSRVVGELVEEGLEGLREVIGVTPRGAVGTPTTSQGSVTSPSDDAPEPPRRAPRFPARAPRTRGFPWESHAPSSSSSSPRWRAFRTRCRFCPACLRDSRMARMSSCAVFHALSARSIAPGGRCLSSISFRDIQPFEYR